MHLKTFVKGLQEDLERLKKNKSDSSNLLIDFESQLTIRQLESLLAQYAQSEDDVSLSPKALKPFVDFLSKRWDRIKDTDAIPMHNPNTLATRICWSLATHLGVELTINPIKLLIPTLKVSESDITNSKFSDLKFQEYILSDANDYPVEVTACLNYAAINRGAFKTTCRVGGDRRDLTPTELARVKDHSVLAQNYHKDILANKFENNDQQLKDSKVKLSDGIIKDTYSVQATYGAVGEKTLEERLVANRDVLFANREQLISYMTSRLKPTDWDPFLSGFKPNQLAKLLIDTDTFKNVVTAKSSYNADVAHDKAVLFCMLDHYWRERDSQNSEYSSFVGRVSGMGWGKSDKEVGVKVLKEFLVSKRDLSELGNFLDLKMKDKGRERIKDILYSRGSNLRIVADEVMVVSKLIADHHLAINKQSMPLKKA